jgi:hypothetical protein
MVSKDARARLVAQRAQIPTEVRPLVLRIPTKGWVLRALSLAGAPVIAFD